MNGSDIVANAIALVGGVLIISLIFWGAQTLMRLLDRLWEA